jgi:hypothetical protein
MAIYHLVAKPGEGIFVQGEIRTATGTRKTKQVWVQGKLELREAVAAVEQEIVELRQSTLPGRKAQVNPGGEK